MKKFKDRSTKYKVVAITIWLSFFATCTALMVSTSDKKKEVSLEDIGENAWQFSKMVVETRLKAPSTAKFEKFSDKNIYLSKDDSIYMVKSYVDAQNSFGAMIRTKYECKVKYRGGDPDDTKNWKLISCQDY